MLFVCVRRCAPYQLSLPHSSALSRVQDGALPALRNMSSFKKTATEEFFVGETAQWTDISVPFNHCSVRVRLMMENGLKGELCVGVALLPLIEVLEKQQKSLDGKIDPLGGLNFDSGSGGLLGPGMPPGSWAESEEGDHGLSGARSQVYQVAKEHRLRKEKGEIQDWVELRPENEGFAASHSRRMSRASSLPFGGIGTFDFDLTGAFKRPGTPAPDPVATTMLSVQMRILAKRPEQRVKSYKRMLEEQKKELAKKHEEAQDLREKMYLRSSFAEMGSLSSAASKNAKAFSLGSVEMTEHGGGKAGKM